MVRISPHAQLVNICIFAALALSMKNPVVPGAQVACIVLSALFFGIRYDKRTLKFLIPLTPVILFILIMNGFRGGGEILFRAGPLVIVKRGLLRGAYYSVFVVELFFMSRVLTGSFSSEEFISALYTIDRVFSRILRKKRFEKHNPGFFSVLYYVIVLFRNSYSELSVLFKNQSPLKDRIILFFRKSFFTSLEEFENTPNSEFHLVRMLTGDIPYILIQVVCLVPAFFLHTLRL
jgi:uncharacterized membrane protein